MNIDNQINDMMKELDKETQLENEITEKAKDIALQLKYGQRTTTLIKGKLYTLSYKQIENAAQVVVIDHTKLAIAGMKYSPALFDLVFDANYTEFENMQKLIETVLYYKHGLINIEDLEDDNDE